MYEHRNRPSSLGEPSSPSLGEKPKIANRAFLVINTNDFDVDVAENRELILGGFVGYMILVDWQNMSFELLRKGYLRKMLACYFFLQKNNILTNRLVVPL